MTLKELLDRCDFKDIAQALVKLCKIPAGELAPFKQAFSIMRHLEPDPTNRLELKLVRDYNGVSITRWFETMEWKYELASEIVVEDGLTLTDAEIAAHCLWELTYNGFDQSTPEKWEEAIMSIVGGRDGLKQLGKVLGKEIDTDTDAEAEIVNSNPYAVAAEKLESELLDKNVDEDDEAWIEVKKLARMARVEDDIRSLTSDTNSFKREELDYLFKTNLITFAHLCSYAYNPSQRIDYLIDLLSNYDMPDYSCSTDFLLMFRTSSAYPLVQSEIDMLQNFFGKYLPASANKRYGYGNDENLETEVSLFLLGSY